MAKLDEPEVNMRGKNAEQVIKATQENMIRPIRDRDEQQIELTLKT